MKIDLAQELLKALEFYANEGSWCDEAHPGEFCVMKAGDEDNIPKTPTTSKVVSGRTARAAIAKAKTLEVSQPPPPNQIVDAIDNLTAQVGELTHLIRLSQ